MPDRDPFWLGVAGIFIVIALFLLIEHSRIAILLGVAVVFALIVYFYSDRFSKKQQVFKKEG